jgi:hypothetical protein
MAAHVWKFSKEPLNEGKTSAIGATIQNGVTRDPNRILQLLDRHPTIVLDLHGSDAHIRADDPLDRRQ